MSDMTTAPQHAKAARRDHIWVLAVIAGFALYDVWESWTQVGNKSGYAHGTGWTLTVIVEAYAAYALFGWFNAPGRRSRRYAMWSALGVLALSLIGQGASSVAAHSMPPVWLAVFVKDLPVIVLALIALLVHLRRLDRDESATAERVRLETAQEAAAEAVAADERTVLRAELKAAASAQGDAEIALGEARQRETEALERADEVARKLAAALAKLSASKDRDRKPKNPHEDDLTTEARALTEMDNDPSLRGPRMGGELARRLGVSAATGRRLHAKLTAQEQQGEPLSEPSAEEQDERSGERA